MRIDAANPNGPPWRCLPVTPEVRAPAEQILRSHGIATDAAIHLVAMLAPSLAQQNSGLSGPSVGEPNPQECASAGMVFQLPTALHLPWDGT
jgi:hypothetical protein